MSARGNRLKPWAAFAPLLLAVGLSACVARVLPSADPPFLARISKAWYDRVIKEDGEIINLAALVRGPLRRINNCIAIGTVTAPALLIVPHTFRLAANNGRYALDSGDGVSVPIGAQFEASGGGGDFIPENLEADVPTRCRFGRYVTINSLKRTR
jgi:hypothetical protein